jgi:hypothetical protein
MKRDCPSARRSSHRRPVTDETARCGEFAPCVHRGQFIAALQSGELVREVSEGPILRNEERARSLSGNVCERGFDFGLVGDPLYNDLSLDRTCGLLQFAQLATGIRKGRIQQHANRRCAGNDVVQQPETFGLQCRAKQADARDIASGPIEARDDAGVDRIDVGDENDRQRRGGCFCYLQCVDADSNDCRNPATDQLGHQVRQPIVVAFRETIFDRNVLSLVISRFLQALAERRHAQRDVARRQDSQETDGWHTGLLRPRRNRPRRCTAEKLDELAPFHIAAQPWRTTHDPKVAGGTSVVCEMDHPPAAQHLSALSGGRSPTYGRGNLNSRITPDAAFSHSQGQQQTYAVQQKLPLIQSPRRQAPAP